MKRKMNGCVVGHSFVSGLRSHLAGRPNANGTSIGLNSQDIAYRLRLEHLIDSIHLIGNRGAKIVDPNFSLPYDELLHIRPGIVIIDLGTNDLAAGTPPIVVAVKVVDIAIDMMRNIHSIKYIQICSAINRDSNLRISNQDMCSAVQQFNRYVRHLCDVEPRVGYHVLKGFWLDPIQIWSRDGIHPNTVTGRRRYKRALRSAFFKAITRLHRLRTRE